MKKIFTLMILIAGFVSAYEITLNSTAVLIAPKAQLINADNWNTNETIVAGDYRKVGNDLIVAQIGGTSSNGYEIASIVTNDNPLVINITGTITPDVTGTYLFNAKNNTYTNTALTWMIYNQAGQYRLSTNDYFNKVATNKFYGESLIGTYTNGGAYTGIATSKFDKVVTTNYSIITPTIVNGLIVDNDVRWLKVPATRKAIIVDAISGVVVYSDALGNKIYTNDISLIGFDGALYGESTEGATVEVFSY